MGPFSRFPCSIQLGRSSSQRQAHGISVGSTVHSSFSQHSKCVVTRSSSVAGSGIGVSTGRSTVSCGVDVPEGELAPGSTSGWSWDWLWFSLEGVLGISGLCCWLMTDYRELFQWNWALCYLDSGCGGHWELRLPFLLESGLLRLNTMDVHVQVLDDIFFLHEWPILSFDLLNLSPSGAQTNTH